MWYYEYIEWEKEYSQHDSSSWWCTERPPPIYDIPERSSETQKPITRENIDTNIVWWVDDTFTGKVSVDLSWAHPREYFYYTIWSMSEEYISEWVETSYHRVFHEYKSRCEWEPLYTFMCESVCSEESHDDYEGKYDQGLFSEKWTPYHKS